MRSPIGCVRCRPSTRSPTPSTGSSRSCSRTRAWPRSARTSRSSRCSRWSRWLPQRRCSNERFDASAERIHAMLPRVLIGTAVIPDTDKELRLYRSGDVFSIKILGRGDLMNSRLHGSEKALAELACARLQGRPHPRLLVGGLGMGFTLAAALKTVGPDAEVVV